MTSKEAQEKVSSYLGHDSDFRAIYAYTRQRFRDAKNLPAHNWEHAYRDLINAIIIGESEDADMSIVLPAAVMHDIGFLYGAASKTHGAIGAEQLENFLKAGGIALAPGKIKKIADCIRTHKGNIHGEIPQSLEAKVVSDADVLDKLGPVGVYQVTKAWTEFNAPFDKTAEMLGRQDRQMQTETGQKLAEPLRAFSQRFVSQLLKAYEPYRERVE